MKEASVNRHISWRRHKTLKHVNSYIRDKFGDNPQTSPEGIHIRKHDRHQLMSYLKKDIRQRDPEGLEQLLQSSMVELAILDPNGRLLMMAVEYHYLDMIDVLLKLGSPVVCDPDASGLSPLHYAVKYGHIDSVQLFVNHNVSLDIVTMYEHRTALHMASRLYQLDTVMLLLLNNADANIPDSYGCTALHLAASLGHEDIARALLSYKANVDVMDYITWTPLHHSVVFDHANVAKILLQHKANISAQTKYGKTALHIACDKGHLASVEVLLAADAVTDIIDIYGRTPVEYTDDELVESLVTNADKPIDNFTEGIKNINMRLRSKSLIDFVDKDFIKEDFYRVPQTNEQRHQSVPDITKTNSKRSRFGSMLLKPFKRRGRGSRRVGIVNDNENHDFVDNNNNGSDLSKDSFDSSNFLMKSNTSSIHVTGDWCYSPESINSCSDDSIEEEIRRIHVRFAEENKLGFYEPEMRIDTPLSMYCSEITIHPPSSTPKLSKEQQRRLLDESENTIEIPDLSYLQEDVSYTYRKDLSPMEHLSTINTTIETLELSNSQYTRTSIVC